MQEVKDVAKLKASAELWTEYKHEYSSIFSKVNWTSKSLHMHNNCRTTFLKESVMSRQQKKTLTDNEIVIGDVSGNADIGIEQTQRRKSSRFDQAYSSSLSSPTCIFCCAAKYDSTRSKISVSTMDRKREDSNLHEVEKTMIQFAEIHLRKNTPTHFGAAERIYLMMGTTGTLFDANVGFHQCCYKSFTSGHFRTPSNTPAPNKQNDIQDLVDEFITVVENLVVRKKEVYTLRQMRELWANVKGVELSSVRAVDVKNLIENNLPTKIQFCKSSNSAVNASEYVYSSDIRILPDAIHSNVTGEGITNHIQLKSISRMISQNIQCHPKYPWPPTPQQIIESDDLIDKRLYNMIAWIVNPNGYIGKDGYVNLTTRKSTKVSEICQNIQSLVPGGHPSLGQILLSLNMYGKTGSKDVVTSLRHLGHGIPYSETLFIMDKWAEWCVRQKSIVPSNMRKGIPTTHVFDNIDWKNKNINRTESHYTNSILVQKYDLTDEFAKVSLELDYDFVRKSHRSFKSNAKELESINFKRGIPRQLEYIPNQSSAESDKSSLKTLAWCILRLSGGESVVPSWSGFQEITTDKDLQQAVVGYLPPIPDSPTNMSVIYEEIKRTDSIRRELELPFIFLGVDQAIYTKVLDAMFRMKDQGDDHFK